jgi:fatty-acyl-CoA synthase
MDERGLLYITGRESDMYISGGSNVYPREVEEVLLTHPCVAEIAILGIPDEKWGEVGVAVVVRREGVNAVQAAELLGSSRRTLRQVPLAQTFYFLGIDAQIRIWENC